MQTLAKRTIEMRNQSGYSLMELIVTIIFVGIVFPGLIAFFTNIMDDSVKNEAMSQAIALAQQQMEEITADKHEPTRGIDYIKSPGQYPSQIVGLHTCVTSIGDTVIGGVDAVQATIMVTHPLVGNPFTLTQLFTNYAAD